MTKKSKQLSRILKIQTDLRKDAEARLARLNARRAELQSVESSILETLSSDDPARRALAPLAGARLRWIERDLQELEAERGVAEAHWRALAQRSLAAGRLEKAARTAERQEEERKDLQELLAEAESRRTSLP